MALELPDDFEVQDAPAVLDRARPMLDLPPDADLRVVSVHQTTRETRIEFTYTVCVELQDGPLAPVAGVEVEVSSRGELRFNDRGNLVACSVEPTDPNLLRSIRGNISQLLEHDKVYFAEPGEEVDPEKLRELGKAWYVEQDAEGKKHLKRAWIS